VSWLSLLAFFLEEALVNLRRHKLVTIATVTTIAVTIGVWMLFYLEARAWEKLLIWEGQKLEQLYVFLKPEANEKDAKKLIEQVQKLPQIVHVKFVHKDEGLKKLQQMFGNSVPLKDLVGHNPLPHVLEVRCRSPQEASKCSAKIKQMPMVDEVTFPAVAVRRYVQLVDSIRWRNHVLSILLAIIAFILIFNALRISVYGRRNEIKIMQFVGATVWTVRGPLLMEGLLYGVLGALGTLVLAKLLLALSELLSQEPAYWSGLLGGWIKWQVLLRDVQIDVVFASQVLLLSVGLSFLSAFIATIRLIKAE